MNSPKTRRQFLGEASCASIGCISTLSSILNLKLTNQAAAANISPGDDSKTIVCILLAGGCDTYNLLVRRDTDGYNTYRNARTGVALGSGANNTSFAGTGGVDALVRLNRARETDSNRYGLHPSCTELADMFNGTGEFSSFGRRLSFVSNIGTLVEPITLAQFQDPNNPIPVPQALFSHRDQVNHWQTSIPQGIPELTGWAGRMADLLHTNFNTLDTSMSISLAGNNIFQIGNETTQLAITETGALLPTGGTTPPLSNLNSTGTRGRKNIAVDGLLAASYNNVIQDAFSTHMEDSHAAQIAFQDVYEDVDISAIPAEIVNNLNRSGIGRDLLAAARTIKARQELGLRRNTIFIERGGWDHHGELLETHSNLLSELSEAIANYQLALEHLGVAEEVISYTASDFGRTLRSNGRGTDHAWGGNQMIWGAPIDAGKVLGTFPDLTLDGDDDIGLGGRILPTTSTDKFFSEMATWFGVSDTDLPMVLPNIGNFSTEPDINFIL